VPFKKYPAHCDSFTDSYACYTSQTDLKTAPADNLQCLSAEERSSCCLVVVTNKNTLREGLELLQHGFLLFSMGQKEVWLTDSSLVTVAEYCCMGRKFILLRKVRQCNYMLYGARHVVLFCCCILCHTPLCHP